jgi:flagellar biosynthetic protein FlhB
VAGEKTEKPTAKRRSEARNKGTVAKSQDLQGSVILLVGILALGAAGPAIGQALGDAMRGTLVQIADPSVVQTNSVGSVLSTALVPGMRAVAPVIGACALAAIVIGALQVGIKPHPQVLKPDPKRLNPVTGFKNLFGPNAVFETGKNLLKIIAVAAVVLSALLPHVTATAGMVGLSPSELVSHMSGELRAIALRAAGAYLVIGLIDYVYQRYRTEKSLKMDKQEVKDEAKNQDLPAEVKGAIRRRQMEAARKRMMADVPTADVVVTNPTHYSVALRYDGESAAPVVVAKGMDHLAFKIREIATEAGVPIVPDPPLARSLHATVEVGQEIPEQLFEAVAQVLAYVYRIANRRRLAG